jgi:hypothetical protein
VRRPAPAVRIEPWVVGDLPLLWAEGKNRFLHAFPSIESEPSNAICRKVGFPLIGECEFEYLPGNCRRCNDWRLDLLEAA